MSSTTESDRAAKKLQQFCPKPQLWVCQRADLRESQSGRWDVSHLLWGWDGGAEAEALQGGLRDVDEWAVGALRERDMDDSEHK